MAINEIRFSEYQTLRVVSYDDIIEIYIDQHGDAQSDVFISTDPDSFKSLVEALCLVSVIHEDEPRLIMQSEDMFKQSMKDKESK